MINPVLARLGASLLILSAFAEPGHAQFASTLTAESPRSLTGVAFHFMADGPVRGGFGIAQGRLLFGTETGTVYAIDQRTGQLRWRHSFGSPVLSTPAILGQTAYFTTWDNQIHAISALTGRERWRRDLGKTRGRGDYWEFYVSSPQIAAGRLYVGSGSGHLFAIDAATGHVIWSFDAGDRVRTTPALTKDGEIIGTMAGRVIAVDRNGHQRWSFATVGAGQDFAFKQNDTRSVVTAPITDGDMVIAGGRDGNIYGIGLRDGKERWHATHDGGSWILGLTPDEGRFYSGSGSAFIVQAAETASGKEIWRSPTGTAMFGGIAKAGDILVSNGINGKIVGFDARTGGQQWSFSLPDSTLSSPLVAAGMVYTGADDGSVYGLKTAAAPPAEFERSIFTYTDEPPASAFWFKPQAKSAILGAFNDAGYANLGTAGLADALASPITKNRRRIIVLADSRLPDGVDANRLRKYLDGGGTLVLLGIDPLIYSFDADGAPNAIDDERSKAAFGIDPSDKQRDFGYNVSTFSAAGERVGLSGQFVALGWANPAQVTTILASDRSGNATAWVKRFRNGGSLIQLPVPRARSIELSRYVDAVDLAAAEEANRRLR